MEAPIFAVDFEADDWQRGLRGTGGGDVRIMQPGDEGFEPLDGRALRVTVAEGSHTGLVVSVHLSDHLRLRRNDRLRIQTVWMNVYYGGREPAPRELHLDIDNLVVGHRRPEEG